VSLVICHWPRFLSVSFSIQHSEFSIISHFPSYALLSADKNPVPGAAVVAPTVMTP
jgi:hypothetical protein